jgi:hypothetical protein
MEKKEYKIEIPDYLTIGQYQTIIGHKESSKIETVVHQVHSLTGIEKKELRGWSPKDLMSVSKKYSHLIDFKSSFFPLIEFKGQLYGYSSIKKAKLGEYIDIEQYAKEPNENLAKLAAILYRPVSKSRFKDYNFIVQQGVKMVRNKVDGNVFDWYEIDDYTIEDRLDREIDMKDFPVHIILGALSFFLQTGLLYTSHIAYSDTSKPEMKIMREEIEKGILETLSQSIGHGGVLYTTSQKQTSLA